MVRPRPVDAYSAQSNLSRLRQLHRYRGLHGGIRAGRKSRFRQPPSPTSVGCKRRRSDHRGCLRKKCHSELRPRPRRQPEAVVGSWFDRAVVCQRQPNGNTTSRDQGRAHTHIQHHFGNAAMPRCLGCPPCTPRWQASHHHPHDTASRSSRPRRQPQRPRPLPPGPALPPRPAGLDRHRLPRRR